MTITGVTIHTNIEVPGRMFNKAPFDFDPIYVEHHVPRKVSSYHDLDRIPTMATRQPETKGCGGSVNSREQMESPNCVTDVKHFDPTAFPDDNAGVSIDLCPVETYESDDDDLCELYEEQPSVQDEELLPEELEAGLPDRASPPTTTTSHLEERRVTFAAQHVVLRLDDEQDSLAVDQRYVHQVFDAVQVWIIPHHTDYREDVRASLWYSPAELAFLKEQASQYRRSRRRNKRKLQQAVQQERFETEIEQERFEAELDKCSLFAPSAFVRPTEEERLSSELSPSERRSLYESMVDAVLLEQFEQRRQWLRIHGRIEEGHSGIHDTNRIAEVCAAVGDTARSQERAVRRAEEVFEDEEEDYDEHRVFLPRDSIRGRSSAPVRGSKKPSPPHHNHSKRSSASIHSSALKVETSKFLDQSIASVFSALLSPFLEIRQGNLFLDVGQEMSVNGH